MRNQTVEPFLSLEMARHLQTDIIANVDVFSAFDVLKKGSKYLRRSSDIFLNDFRTAPGLAAEDTALCVLATQIDEKVQRKVPIDQLVTFIDKEFRGGQFGPAFDVTLDRNGTATLQASREVMVAFLERVQKTVWTNVSLGFDERIRYLQDLVTDPNEARKRDRVEKAGKELLELVKMLSAGLDAIGHEDVRIPSDVRVKMQVLAKLLEGLPKTRRFALPQEELERIRELLRAAAPSENSLLLTAASVLDRLDRWAVERYETLAPKGEPITLADAKIDALNSVLDVLDDTTLSGLREHGIIQFTVDAQDGRGGRRTITVLNIGAINQRLNQSILGKIGNNTAFKAVNLAQEAQAYYECMRQAATPGEAFANLATEFFRRRVPGGGAAEAYVMGNYGRCCVEVCYLVFPPLAIYEAIQGMAVAVWDAGVDAWWSAELQLFADRLYDRAEFDPPDNDPAAKPPFRLVAVTHGEHRDERERLENGTSHLLADAEVDETLRKNLAATDPYLSMLDESRKHPAAGEKVQQHFAAQIDERWRKVKADFVRRMIARLEERKKANHTVVQGDMLTVYEKLLAVARELDIEEPIEQAIEAQWDTVNLKTAWTWLKDLKRGVRGQPPVESEQVRVATVLNRYYEAYRSVLDARIAAEQAIQTIFAEAAIPTPETLQHNQRLLTGLALLNCDPAPTPSWPASGTSSPKTLTRRSRRTSTGCWRSTRRPRFATSSSTIPWRPRSPSNRSGSRPFRKAVFRSSHPA